VVQAEARSVWFRSVQICGGSNLNLFQKAAGKAAPQGRCVFTSLLSPPCYPTQLAQVWSFRCGGLDFKHPAHCLLHVLPRALLESCVGWTSWTTIIYHQVHCRVFCLNEKIQVTFTTNVNRPQRWEITRDSKTPGSKALPQWNWNLVYTHKTGK